jgi:hypothetical protein
LPERQLDAGPSALQLPAPVDFTGTPLDRDQLLALMELTCRFDPKLQVKIRSFREPFRNEVRAAPLA